MTTIQSHKNRLFKKQVALFGFLLLLTVIFLFSFGFKILFGTSLFINQIFNKDDALITPTKEIFLGDLTIDSIPEATNSATILVSGFIDKFDSVAIYLNETKVDEIKIASNSFNFEIKDLQKGENKLYFLAKSNKHKEKKQTETFKVLYADEKPKIEIKEPADQLKTVKNEIKIIASTAKENVTKINGFPIVLDVQGNFESSVKLKNGENKIIILVIDIYGNSEEKTLTIIKEE